MTLKPCLAQDGHDMIFNPFCLKFNDFSISLPTFTSLTGSSDNETLIVSPIPSNNNVPRPIDVFMCLE